MRFIKNVDALKGGKKVETKVKDEAEIRNDISKNHSPALERCHSRSIAQRTILLSLSCSVH